MYTDKNYRKDVVKLNIANEISKNAIQLINELNEKAQSENVGVEELTERIRAIDMLLHSIAHIKNLEQPQHNDIMFESFTKKITSTINQ